MSHPVSHWIESKLLMTKPKHVSLACYLPFILIAVWMVTGPFRALFVADHHLAGAGERVPEWDAAVRPAGAAVCSEESVGAGAPVCRPIKGQGSHHCDHTLTGSNSAGHQAGESYL